MAARGGRRENAGWNEDDEARARAEALAHRERAEALAHRAEFGSDAGYGRSISYGAYSGSFGYGGHGGYGGSGGFGGPSGTGGFGARGAGSYGARAGRLATPPHPGSGESREAFGVEATRRPGRPGGWASAPARGGVGARGREAHGPHYGKGPRGYVRPDERILEDVCEAVAEDGDIDASDVEVSVAKGIVTFTGTVTGLSEKRILDEIATRVHGVREVRNDVHVEANQP